MTLIPCYACGNPALGHVHDAEGAEVRCCSECAATGAVRSLLNEPGPWKMYLDFIPNTIMFDGH